MKHKEIFSALILGSLLLLSGCGASDMPKMKEADITPDVETEERGEDTVITGEMLADSDSSAENEEFLNEEEWVWQNVNKSENAIHVTADQLQGNILGYSLLRYSPNPENQMYYERDMAYLVEEEFVGKGIYISDYMCETEVFLGSILKEALEDRGAVSGENRQYFTEYALRQLEEADWETLDTQWKADSWTYDRYYSMLPLFGGGGYQFSYYFFENEEETDKEEMNQIFMKLYVDTDGKICEIELTVNAVPTENNRIERSILENGLFDDNYSEPVIREGRPCREEMTWDFERYYRRFMNPDEIYEQENKGLLQSENASSSAEALAEIFLHVMENRGTDVEKYAEYFGYDTDFSKFAGTDWGALEKNWKASEAYDCLFLDRVESGYVGFQYYFYPDYTSMGVDEAMMVVIGCNVGCEDGRIDYNTVDIIPITEKVYRETRERQERSKVLVVEQGVSLAGKEKVAIPVIGKELQYIPISEFDVGTAMVEHSNRKEKEELWEFTDVAEVGAYLGEKFLQDFTQDHVEDGEIYKLTGEELKEDEVEKRIYGISIGDALYQLDKFEREGWKTEGRYDCYHVSANEVEACLHLQYYFYPKRNGEEQIKDRTMVVDVLLSEGGIEKVEVNEFCERYFEK